MANKTAVKARKLTEENLTWIRYVAACRAWLKGASSAEHMRLLERTARIHPTNVRITRFVVALQRMRPFTEARVDLQRACVELAEKKRVRGSAPETMKA